MQDICLKNVFYAFLGKLCNSRRLQEYLCFWVHKQFFLHCKCSCMTIIPLWMDNGEHSLLQNIKLLKPRISLSLNPRRKQGLLQHIIYRKNLRGSGQRISSGVSASSINNSYTHKLTLHCVNYAEIQSQKTKDFIIGARKDFLHLG